MSGKWSTAWRTVAAQVADEREGWQLTRPGQPDLAHVPVGWWLARVGFDPPRGGTRGRLFVSVVPLTLPITHGITGFGGFLQDQFAGEQPRLGFDPTAEDAVDVLRWWMDAAVQPLLETNRPPQQWAEMCELEYVHTPEEPPRVWPMLAGWRLLTDSGDPLPVIDGALDLIARGRGASSREGFFQELRTRVVEDRQGAKGWLDERRRGWLAEIGVQPEQMLTEPPTEGPQP